MRSFTGYPALPQLPPAQREAWEMWFVRHGIDVNTIPLGTEVECDDLANRIYFTQFDPEGERENINEMPKKRTYVQLEAPALPFPVSGEWPHGQLEQQALRHPGR